MKNFLPSVLGRFSFSIFSDFPFLKNLLFLLSYFIICSLYSDKREITLFDRSVSIKFCKIPSIASSIFTHFFFNSFIEKKEEDGVISLILIALLTVIDLGFPYFAWFLDLSIEELNILIIVNLLYLMKRKSSREDRPKDRERDR